MTVLQSPALPRWRTMMAKAAPAKERSISVSARMFDAAAICASNDPCRYYINGVYVRPHPEGGALLVATDGHRLVAIRDEAGECSEPTIVGTGDKAFRRALKSVKGDEPLILKGDGIPAIPGVFLGGESVVIDGSFPQWERTLANPLDNIKAKKPYGPATFDSRYLADFDKVGQRIRKVAPTLRCISFTESDPALFLWPSVPNAFAILMPLRSENLTAFPTWVRPVVEPAIARAEAKAAKLAA